MEDKDKYDSNKEEFTPEKDPFMKARRKGPKYWIISHIFHSSNKFLFIISLFATIFSAIVWSGAIVFIGYIINDFIAGDTTNLTINILIIFILGISSPILDFLNSLCRETLAQRIEKDARKEFFANLLGKSQSFHDLQKTGDIMARATNDVRMLNLLISPALSLIINSFTSLFIPIFFIILYYPLQLIIAPSIFILIFLISLRIYVKRLGPITNKLRAEFGQMNAILNETLSGIEVVKSTAQENQELKKYSKNATEYKNAFIKQGDLQAKYLPILFIAITITLGLAHSIFLNYYGLLTIGQIISFVGLLIQLRFPTYISVFVFSIVRLAISGAKRLLNLMNEKTEIDQNPNGIVKKTGIQESIVFDEVTFTYPNTETPVLEDISFTLKAGQTLAIVGTTGSGKSTLTKLISRLYDISKGRILIDGIDIRDYTLESLRSKISYIEQDIFLFSSSIYENISFGKASSMDEVIKVAKLAQAHEFIMDFPNGYESEIGERGVQLSGGERQRIAIARSFLLDPPILVLDDSTSAIDSETEDKIIKAINRIRKDRTTFLITHRLSQIRWSDSILVLKNGKIDAQGTHKKLLVSSEEYRKIFVKKFDVNLNQLLEACEE